MPVMRIAMSKTRFARIIAMRAKPGKGDEFLRTFRKEVAPTAVELEGLRRLYLLRRVGRADEFVAFSLWDDEKAAVSYAKSSANKKYAEKLVAVQKGKESVRKYKVELHVVGKSIKEADD
jgi:heme-degrading monooxygenase HmoA